MDERGFDEMTPEERAEYVAAMKRLSEVLQRGSEAMAALRDAATGCAN